MGYYTNQMAMGRRAKVDQWEADGKLIAKGKERCDRCGGAGGYSGWPGFTCFKCGGYGFVAIKARWWVHNADGVIVDYRRTLKDARVRADEIGGRVWDSKTEAYRSDALDVAA